MRFATKPNDITHLTLGMLLHYLGKLKIQILCRHSADMQEMQTNCIKNAPILIPLRVYLCMFLSKSCYRR